MSADNGIFVAKFPDGYRVAYASCIDNINFFPEGTKERKRELKKYFGKSKLFKDGEEARFEAMDMEEKFIKNGGFLEYGVCFLGEYESFN